MQLKKAHAQQRRPNAANIKKKYIYLFILNNNNNKWLF